MSWLLIALRNIRRDGMRVVSTILIIAVGLAALLIGGGFMLSAYDSLQEMALRSEGNVIVLADSPNPTFGGSHQQLTLANWRPIQDKLWTDERVVRVLPRARFEGIVSKGVNSAAFFGTGIDPKDEFHVHGPFLRTSLGGTLNPWPGPNDMPDVVMGDELARTLDAQVGDTLTLHTFNIEGVATEVNVILAGLYTSGTPAVDNYTLMVSLKTAAQLTGTENISQLSVYLQQRDQTQPFKQMLQTQLKALKIESWDQRAQLYDGVKGLYDRIFSVMGLIILVVVFLAISNTVALAIFHRRDEIATLGALGTGQARIFTNFTLEALIVGIIATTLGMLLAYAIATSINMAGMWMPPPPGKTEGYPLYIYVSWPHYFVASLVLIVVVILASLVATYQNARVNIAQALS